MIFRHRLTISILLLSGVFVWLAGLSMVGGCAPAVIGSAGYSGYKAARDERSIGTMMNDSILSTTVKSRLISDDFVKARHIDVDVLSGIVYLIGVVESDSQRRMAADIARGVDGTRQINNQLLVGSTTAGQILNDALMTSKINVELIKDPIVSSTNVDVDTHNNIVTLTGIVDSAREKARILQITQRVSGNRQTIDNLSIGP